MITSTIPPKRVLIIDDDPDIRNWFRILQKGAAEYSVHFLQEGPEGLPDLIFMDTSQLQLERLSEIIQLAREKNVPIVHMSTSDSFDVDLVFMRKPLERKAVEAKIRSLLKI